MKSSEAEQAGSAPAATEPAAAEPAAAEPAAAEPAVAEPAVAGPAAEVAEAPPALASLTADVTAPPGGVMTDEVGVITGDLTLRTDFADGKVVVNVQYKDAAEWYVVTGGKAELKDASDAAAVHKIVAAILNRPEE